MDILIIVFCLVLGLIIFFVIENYKNDEALEKRSKDLNSYFCGMYRHCVGLPAPECVVYIHQFVDKLLLIADRSEFTIPYDRVTNISYLSDSQVQTQYVSSAGGAVAGGILLGPLGALLGGRTKKMTDIKTTYYLIISYVNKDGELTSVSLEDAYPASSNKDRFLSYFSQTNLKSKEPINIEL